MSWIDDRFPEAAGAYVKTSECSGVYNCIAWAAGESHRWWQHHPGYYWPAQRSEDVTSLIAVFESLGFVECGDNGDPEDGYDKVVIYARNGNWKHAARQLPDGRWASKLGEYEDIEHDTAEALTQTMYGLVHCYMRRPKDG